MEPKLKRTISVREMGQLLGLRKVESYWLVHKASLQSGDGSHAADTGFSYQ